MGNCNVPGYFLQFTAVERVCAQLKITTDAAMYCACPDADPADECKKHQHAFRAATGVAGGQSHRHRTTLHPGKPPRNPTNLTPAGLNRPVTQPPGKTFPCHTTGRSLATSELMVQPNKPSCGGPRLGGSWAAYGPAAFPARRARIVPMTSGSSGPYRRNRCALGSRW